jgi:signal transduction histidine kinase
MYIDAATNLIETNPGRAREILRSARGDVATALDDVRRVVYGLRPLALDEKGLVAALAELCRDGAPEVTVQADALPPLSPAVELAAYRIAAEGITNARRHAADGRVRVRLTPADGELAITVDDDGRASNGYRPGAGLRFVAERAEELGGWASAGPRQGGGWRMDARLPI